mmetsp:Transcript_34751/g.66076  ORF Transcript_34751/g.66076 Transcript_34751/m.66076 type:complete len:136 (+) Transcript_34751:328-735(+)
MLLLCLSQDPHRSRRMMAATGSNKDSTELFKMPRVWHVNCSSCLTISHVPLSSPQIFLSLNLHARAESCCRHDAITPFNLLPTNLRPTSLIPKQEHPPPASQSTLSPNQHTPAEHPPDSYRHTQPMHPISCVHRY